MATQREDESVLNELLSIASRAAAAIVRVYATDFGVDYKSPNDPVTLADREANGIICDALARAFPGVPVVAEESPPESYAGFRDADAAFFVDPLDGTRDFVKRNGEFVVMIGMAEAGRAKYGAIHAPATGRAFAGGGAIGAFEAIAHGTPQATRRVIRVSDARAMTSARLVVSRSRPSAKLLAIARELGIAEVTELGSAGLKALRVASGECELYAHGGVAGSRWDACAPEAITRAAGGVTTDLDGALIDYRGPALENDRGIVVSNGHLHEAMLAALAELARAHESASKTPPKTS